MSDWEDEVRKRLERLDLSQATPAEIEAIQRSLVSHKLDGSFRDFVVAADPRFVIYPHCELIIDKIQQLHNGDFDRLMIMMPPRHSKSYLATLLYPAYFLHQNSEKFVILTACTADLARGKFSVELREFMKQDPINMGEGASGGKDIWRTPEGGGVIAAGAGGTIIGYGGHLIVIDDPVKDREAATSTIQQQKNYDWYRTVTDTRMEPGCKMLLIMQRWHDLDLAGQILENEGDYWETLKLPAIAEEDDPMGREVGEPLCPERFPLEVLHQKRSSMGAVFFASMYQQNPIPEGGLMFSQDNARYFKRLDPDTISLDGQILAIDDCQQFLCMDMAHSTRSTADYTVLGHFLVTPSGDLVLNHLWRGRWKATQVESMVKEKIEHFPYCRFVVIESTQASISTIEEIRKVHVVRDPKPSNGKTVRAVPAQVLQERGKFWTPDPDDTAADWMVKFEDELYRFPASKHDDQVDVVSLAVEHMQELVNTGELTFTGPPEDLNLEYMYSNQHTAQRNSKLFPWMNDGER